MSTSENLSFCNIGENIKSMRKALGYTQQELADKMAEYSGKSYSASVIGTWERATRELSALDAYFLAQALQTSLESLYVYKQANLSDVDVRAFVSAVKNLPRDDKHILEYLLTRWSGNRHVLLHLCAMLMNVDRRTQADMMGMCAMLYREKAIVKANIDVDAVENEWERLLTKK